MSSSFFYSQLPTKEIEHICAFIEQYGACSAYQNPLFINCIEPNKNKSYLIKKEDNKIISFTVIVEHFKFAKIYFGPIVINNEIAVIHHSIIDIIEYYKKKNFASIDIQLPLIDKYKFDLLNNLLATDYKINYLPKKFNWSTVILKINELDLLQIFNSFSKNHKRSINKAIKNNFIIKKFECIEDAEKFSILYNQTYLKRKLIKPFHDSNAVFSNLFQISAKNSTVLCLGVFSETNELYGGVILFAEGKKLFYQYGASASLNNLPILHIAFYKVIEYAISNHFEEIDFGGYNRYKTNDEQINNINRFKKGFGGDIVDYPEILSFRLNIINYYFYHLIKMTYRFYKKCKFVR